MTELGTKYDEEKPDFSLIDAEWLEEVAKVMTFGKRKYSAHNWRQGISISRLLAAAARHLFAVIRGEDNDPETGLSHLAHLSCCAMFANWTLKHRGNLDDRYKSAKQNDGKVPLPTRGFTGLRVGLGQPLGPTITYTGPGNYSLPSSLDSPPAQVKSTLTNECLPDWQFEEYSGPGGWKRITKDELRGLR